MRPPRSAERAPAGIALCDEHIAVGCDAQRARPVQAGGELLDLKPGGTCNVGTGGSLHHRRPAMRGWGERKARHRIRRDVPHDAGRIVVPVAVCSAAGERLIRVRDGCRRQQQQGGMGAEGQADQHAVIFAVDASESMQSRAGCACTV